MNEPVGTTRVKLKDIRKSVFGEPKAVVEWQGKEYTLRVGDWLELNLFCTSLRVDFDEMV